MRNKIKKILHFIAFILTGIICIFTLIIVICGARAVKKNEILSVFGYTFSLVPTPSMEPEINPGDYCIGEKRDYDSIKVGDNVVYFSEEYGIYIVHKVIRYDEGLGYKTKGINEVTNPVEDKEWVTEDNYVSTIVWNGQILSLGTFFVNNKAIVFILLIVVLSMLLVNGILDMANNVKNEKSKETLDKEDEIRKRLEEELRKKYEDESNSIQSNS